ncbi:hypothetical protein [Nocardia asteroides]|uniref:hypothetical protein n=1 Tax=Nocardia asteroides TaxID=1824 RepID=UPI0033D06605
MSITRTSPSSPDRWESTITCDATDCTESLTVIAHVHPPALSPFTGRDPRDHKMFRDAGWSVGNGKVGTLCPVHCAVTVTLIGGHGMTTQTVPVTIGAGGGGGGNSQDAEIVRLRNESAKRRRDELAIRDHFPEVAAIDRDDSVRALLVHARYLSNSLAAIQSLIPADVLEDGDTVDGVRRLAAEHQQVTAAHAKAADDRDLYMSQRDELERENGKLGEKHRRATALIGEQTRELADLRAKNTAHGIAEKMRRRGMFSPGDDVANAVYHVLAPVTPGLAGEQIPGVVADLVTDRIEWRALAEQFRNALGLPIQPATPAEHLPEAVRNLRHERDAYLIQRDKAWGHLRAIREALGADDQLVSFADLATVARGMVENLDQETATRENHFRILNEIHTEIPSTTGLFLHQLPNAVRNLAADRALCADERDRATEDAKRWGDLLHELRGILTGNTPGVAYTDLPDLLRKLRQDRDELGEHLAHRNATGEGEAFIPLTPKRDAEPEPAVEHPSCDRCDQPKHGRWTVPDLKTVDGRATVVCLTCLAILQGGALR